jgi:hypothetical protein
MAALAPAAAIIVSIVCGHGLFRFGFARPDANREMKSSAKRFGKEMGARWS